MAVRRGATPLPIRVDWRLLALGALGLAVLFTFQNYTTVPQPPPTPPSLLSLFGQQVVIWSSWLAVAPLIFAIARRWRAAPRFTIAAVGAQLVLGAAVALLQGALAGVGRWTLGLSISPDLGVVLSNSVGTYFGSGLLRYGLIALGYHVVAYQHEIREREVGAARLEAGLAQAKLEALQGRLHPHFLFNTLNSIGALIREDPRAAEQMLEHLGELLRASLAAEPNRLETLERELDLVRQYIAIQKMRFRERLDVAVDVPSDLLHLRVPHLLLQPLVENAIRHGLAPREQGGRVRIHAARRDGTLVLQVEDDGVGIRSAPVPPVTGPGGFGLNGTRARLDHLYGKDASLDVRRAEGAGTIVTITLPARLDTAAGARG